MTESKNFADIAWSPTVPPGHSRYSWVEKENSGDIAWFPIVPPGHTDYSYKTYIQDEQTNDIIESEHSVDVSWTPEVPPGHTSYSWESSTILTSVVVSGNCKKEKAMTVSVKQMMKKFKSNKQETKHQTKNVQPHSQYLISENGSIQWNKKEEKELTKEEIAKICEVVEYSIMNQADDNIPRISQGVHDHYVTFCVQHKRKLLFVEDFQWHTCNYTQIKSGTLTLNKAIWAEEKIESLASLTENDALQFVEEVEHCLYARFPISKVVDSIYLEYCASQNHQAMAYYTGQEAYEHGYRLLHGVMVPIDKQTAIHYIQQAAELDQYAAAQSLLGYCYQFGDAVRIDVEQAIEHYQIAVDNGDAFGKIRLGRCYLAGIGIPMDKKKAHNLFDNGIPSLRLIANSKRADSNRALCLLHSQPAEH